MLAGHADVHRADLGAGHLLGRAHRLGDGPGRLLDVAHHAAPHTRRSLHADPQHLGRRVPGIAGGFGDGGRDLGCAKVDGRHELFLRFGHAALQRTTTWSANRPSSSA